LTNTVFNTNTSRTTVYDTTKSTAFNTTKNTTTVYNTITSFDTSRNT
jgi:hypothetical protein